MSKSGKLNKFYQNNQLVTEISDDVQRSVFRGQGRFLGHLASRDERTPSVSAVDGEDTVMAEPQANCLAQFAYTPYGDRARLNEPDTPWAYHGERLDGLSGGYALGNGYRLYRPALMRFGAPDNMSPFGPGMLNAYAYCLGDPVNHSDPSGHFAVARMLRFAALAMMGTTLVAATALAVAAAVQDSKKLYEAAIGVALGGAALTLAPFIKIAQLSNRRGLTIVRMRRELNEYNAARRLNRARRESGEVRVIYNPEGRGSSPSSSLDSWPNRRVNARQSVSSMNSLDSAEIANLRFLEEFMRFEHGIVSSDSGMGSGRSSFTLSQGTPPSSHASSLSIQHGDGNRDPIDMGRIEYLREMGRQIRR